MLQWERSNAFLSEVSINVVKHNFNSCVWLRLSILVILSTQRGCLTWNAILFAMLTYTCGCQKSAQHWKTSHGSTALGFCIAALHMSLPTTWNTSSCEVPHISVQFHPNSGFLDWFLQKSPVSNATEIRPVGDALMHAAREMERHDDAKSRFARDHDPCKRLHDVRKSRLTNTKKPVERKLVLRARQIGTVNPFIHRNANFVENLDRAVNYGTRHSYCLPKDLFL
jgi:hypothetical protein